MAFDTFTRDTILTEEGARRLVEILENPPELAPEQVKRMRSIKATMLKGEEAAAFLRKRYGRRDD